VTLKILAIDPGTKRTGYAVLDVKGHTPTLTECGCVFVRGKDLPERLLAIHTLVDDLIALHQPQIVAVERLFFSKNVQTAFAVGQARGVVLLAAAEHEVPVREATPNEVKSAIAGYGAADKEQVQRMVQMVLAMPERPRPDDAADALAIAVWAANTEGSGVGAATAAVMDRSAVAPITRGASGYERAVREALAAEKAETRAGKRNAS